MENNVKKMVEYINYMIIKNIELLKNDLTIKESADIERISELMIQTESIQRSDADIDFHIYLSNFNKSIEETSNQNEMIKKFRDFISNLADYSGFFVLKNDKAVCFDVYPEDSSITRGYSFDFLNMDDDYCSLENSSLPNSVKDIFNGFKNVYVFPIHVKYKHSGYVIASLKELSSVNIIRVAISILSREFTLLPLKAKLKSNIQNDTSSQSHVQETQPQPQPQPQNSEHKTIEVQDDGEIVITNSVSGSYAGDEDELTRAKKYAKLLVDELELYNKKAVDKGRMKGSLKSLLKSDIERSYESFRHRFGNSDKVPDEIFEQAILMYLAKGNPDLL